MTPEEWYVVDMERDYFLQPQYGSYTICSSDMPIGRGWVSRDTPDFIIMSGTERVVTRSEMLACIDMMRAKKAMEAT